jgi:hypothetical protein
MESQLNQLAQQVTALQTELDAVRAEHQVLQRRWQRRGRVRRATVCGGFVVFGLALAMNYAAARTAAQGQKAQAPAAPLTVRAPFEVVDDSGKTVMAVLGGGKGLARGMGVYSFEGKLTIQASSDPNDAEPYLAAYRADGKHRFDIGKKGFMFNNDLGAGIVHLGSQSGAGPGYLVIGDAQGSAMVEAAVAADGTGLVRAYPLGTKSPLPIPWFIKGGVIK